MAQRHMYVRQSLITAKKSKTAVAMHHKGAWLFCIWKLLSLMTITRERQPHHSGRKTGGRCDPCAGEWSDERVRNFYWKYVRALSPCGRTRKRLLESLLTKKSFSMYEHTAKAKHWGKAKLFRSGLDVVWDEAKRNRTAARRCNIGFELAWTAWIEFKVFKYEHFRIDL